jgi:hypothetical protein
MSRPGPIFTLTRLSRLKMRPLSQMRTARTVRATRAHDPTRVGLAQDGVLPERGTGRWFFRRARSRPAVCVEVPSLRLRAGGPVRRIEVAQPRRSALRRERQVLAPLGLREVASRDLAGLAFPRLVVQVPPQQSVAARRDEAESIG